MDSRDTELSLPIFEQSPPILLPGMKEARAAQYAPVILSCKKFGLLCGVFPLTSSSNRDEQRDAFRGQVSVHRQRHFHASHSLAMLSGSDAATF